MILLQHVGKRNLQAGVGSLKDSLFVGGEFYERCSSLVTGGPVVVGESAIRKLAASRRLLGYFPALHQAPPDKI